MSDNFLMAYPAPMVSNITIPPPIGALPPTEPLVPPLPKYLNFIGKFVFGGSKFYDRAHVFVVGGQVLKLCGAFSAVCGAFSVVCGAFSAICGAFSAVCSAFSAVGNAFSAVCCAFSPVGNAFSAVCSVFRSGSRLFEHAISTPISTVAGMQECEKANTIGRILPTLKQLHSHKPNQHAIIRRTASKTFTANQADFSSYKPTIRFWYGIIAVVLHKKIAVLNNFDGNSHYGQGFSDFSIFLLILKPYGL